MKKLFLIISLAAATWVAFAQGKIAFVNDAGRPFMMPPTGGPILPADAHLAGQPITGVLPSGNVITALLYAGESADSLLLQTAVNLVGADVIAPGRMALKLIILTGVDGGAPQFFQIILTDSTGTTIPTSIVGGTATLEWIATGADYFGTSGLFTATPGIFPLIYASAPPALSTWPLGPVVLNYVPEPSALALAGVGAFSAMVFRRRK